MTAEWCFLFDLELERGTLNTDEVWSVMQTMPIEVIVAAEEQLETY